MKKIYLMIILSFLTISSLVFISCGTGQCSGMLGVEGTCDITRYCKTDVDCGEYRYCSLGGVCISNPCSNTATVFCGRGTCTPGDNPETEDKTEAYYCKCDEGSLPYDYYQEGGYPLICTPKCKIHNDCNEAYVNFGHQIAGYCIKGQCQERNYCEQNSDCPDGEICETKHCRTAPIDGK